MLLLQGQCARFIHFLKINSSNLNYFAFFGYLKHTLIILNNLEQVMGNKIRFSQSVAYVTVTRTIRW